MTTYAYLRVSTNDQTIMNQRIEIENAGFRIDEWVEDEGISGATNALEREGFRDMMQKLKKGDVVIVKAIDRIGRNASDILAVVEKFKKMNVGFRIVQLDSIDLTSSMGKCLITIMSAFAELELATIRERTKAGVARAISEGKAVGRESKIDPDKIDEAKEMLNKGITQKIVAQFLNVSERNLRRFVDDIKNNSENFKSQLQNKKLAFSKQREYNLNELRKATEGTMCDE